MAERQTPDCAFGSCGGTKQRLVELLGALPGGLVVEQLRIAVNDKIISSVDLGADPSNTNAADALLPSIQGTFSRLEDVSRSTDISALRIQAAAIETRLRGSFDDDSWLREFPGRSILRRFAGEHLAKKANYEAFRNVIIDQMVDGNYQPPGMLRVIEDILAADTFANL